MVKDLTVAYPDGKVAVEGVGFTLRPGETAALIGANGAGKTTLFLAIVGVLPKKSGSVFAGGVLLRKNTLRALRAKVGLVFQNPDDQLFSTSVYEDIAFGPRRFGYSAEETDARVEEALGQLGIGHLRDRSPLKLSDGEKRLCAIAAVLAHKPEILLFDEPTAFLDPRARRSLTGVFASLPQIKLIATHDLAFVEATCSRVLLLQEGKLVADRGMDLLGDTAALEAAGL